MFFFFCQQGFCVEGYVYHNSNNELQIRYTSKRRKHKQKRFHERNNALGICKLKLDHHLGYVHDTHYEEQKDQCEVTATT